MRRLSMATRKELTAVAAESYRDSNRAEKARILDEFVDMTGNHRKQAMRMLRGRVGVRTGRGSLVGSMTRQSGTRSCCFGKRRTGFAVSGLRR